MSKRTGIDVCVLTVHFNSNVFFKCYLLNRYCITISGEEYVDPGQIKKQLWLVE